MRSYDDTDGTPVERTIPVTAGVIVMVAIAALIIIRTTLERK
jgi:hypothetical protein